MGVWFLRALTFVALPLIFVVSDPARAAAQPQVPRGLALPFEPYIPTQIESLLERFDAPRSRLQNSGRMRVCARGFHPQRRCAMSEKDIQKDDLVGKTKAIRDHDHDMIHDLSKRLDAVWRYDQYIENADKFPEVQRFWQESKQTEIQTIERLKELIREHVRKDNF